MSIMDTTDPEAPLLDHHFRVPWDEEAGLQLEAVWRRGQWAREQQAAAWAQAEIEQRRVDGGWIGGKELETILEAELAVLGRPAHDHYRLSWRFRRALLDHLPTEMIADESRADRYYGPLWIIPLPHAGREITLELFRLMAHRGLRTGSLPKAVQDVIRSRKIKQREGQSRVVTVLAK